MNLALEHKIQHHAFSKIPNRPLHFSWPTSTCSMMQTSVHNFQSKHWKENQLNLWAIFSKSRLWRIRECKHFEGEICVQISAANWRAVGSWEGCLFSLNHGFLTCEMGLIMPITGFYVKCPVSRSPCVVSGVQAVGCHWWCRWYHCCYCGYSF